MDDRSMLRVWLKDILCVYISKIPVIYGERDDLLLLSSQ